MAMKKIPVSSLKPGMIFSRPVFVGSNDILVEAQKPLTLEKILDLRKKGIEFVETSGDIIGVDEKYKDSLPQKSLLDAEASQYISWFSSLVENMTFVFEKFKVSGNIEKEKVKETAEKIVAEIEKVKDYNVLINLLHIAEKGDYFSLHAVKSAILGGLIGRLLGYTRFRLINLVTGILLMDIGMLMIPAYILEKEEKLTAEEYNQIKTHPLHAYKILVHQNGYPNDIGLIALEHHERFDGTGYPRGLREIHISEYARIAGIADTYIALISKRTYREKFISYEAMKTVLMEGSTKFDPQILRVFLKLLSIYPVGSYVKLNNNAIAKVIASDPISPFRPTVKIVIDEFGDRVEDGEIVKLSMEKDLYIVKALSKEEVEQLL